VIFSMRFEPWPPVDRRRANDAVERWRLVNENGSNGVLNVDDSLPPGGQTLRQAFEALVNTLNEAGVRYAIIGGLAVIQHTRIRTTDDIDALLAVSQVAMPGLFERLQQRGFDIDLQRNIKELRDGGITAIRFADVIVDLMQPVIPAYAHVLDRAINADILGQNVRVSSAEGLIVMKLVAMRPQDETDVQDLLAAYGGRLDLDFIRGELATFTEPADPRRVRFENWVRQAVVEG